MSINVANRLNGGAGESVLREIKKTGATRVPNIDILRLGDVILSKPGNKSRGKIPLIEAYQHTVPRFQGQESASWCHAMLYLGNLHIAESNTRIKLGKFKRESGVRVAPLVFQEDSTELIICRRHSDTNIPDFDDFMRSAAHLALMDYALKKREYGYDRIALLAAQYFKWKRLIPFLGLSNFGKSIICSEYVLLCLATGAEVLTEEWTALSSTNFFYPADFYQHKDFETIPMEYVSVNRT